ncbi:hypothetical protein BHF71_11135 [Vulcanibacillus modesticaldus]|uniref:N-acetyltransferase domain-containing protein n=1 Tax=Vulcanibacillus modesticaldus TaxID=337097 RepID=A0A1D2YSL8_9BACI|nr:hypothetical protein [Vulcanibacillus modesticaldus]OEF97594.1 hypothetical protein BHF71_11135 [Vulcanibacillus modesticaldus]
MIIESKKLRFRKTRTEDLDYVIDTEQDLENKKYIIPWSRKKHLEAISNRDKLHLIVETNDLKTVGFIIIAGIENENNSIELIRLIISEKNQGYGKESMNLVLESIALHKSYSG